MGSIVDGKPAHDASPWISKAYSVFDELALSGNLIAQSQKSEVQQLEGMFYRLDAGLRGPQIIPRHLQSDATNLYNYTLGESIMSPSARAPVDQGLLPVSNGIFSPISDMLGDTYIDNVFTSAQIMDLANSINTGDMEWMSQAVNDYELW